MNTEWLWIIGGLVAIWLLWPMLAGQASPSTRDVPRPPPEDKARHRNPIEEAVDMLYQEEIEDRKKAIKEEVKSYAKRRFEPIAGAKPTAPTRHEAAELGDPKSPATPPKP